MSNVTPPGWYADTGTPGTERWWDGAAWTAHTRPTAAVRPEPHQRFGPPQYPQKRSGGGSGRSTRVVALTLSALVTAGAAVTAVVVLGEDDGGGTRPRSAPSSAAPVPAATDADDSPAPSESPSGDANVLVDQLNGITVPVPDGWEKPENTVDDATTMRTVDSYTCPGDSGSHCYHGTVTTRTASGTDLTAAEALAKEDIIAAADRAYGENIVGDRIHGGITSHKELESRSVSVAGRTGHLVRWQVSTGKGPGGYVQSLVFPATVGSESPVIVRFAFDAARDELPLALMDTITRGIRPLGDSAASGGVGSSVGP